MKSETKLFVGNTLVSLGKKIVNDAEAHQEVGIAHALQDRMFQAKVSHRLGNAELRVGKCVGNFGKLLGDSELKELEGK
jgi:hypothetical protein